MTTREFLATSAMALVLVGLPVLAGIWLAEHAHRREWILECSKTRSVEKCVEVWEATR